MADRQAQTNLHENGAPKKEGKTVIDILNRGRPVPGRRSRKSPALAPAGAFSKNSRERDWIQIPNSLQKFYYLKNFSTTNLFVMNLAEK
uniref:Uncharacterized protein n=1 Tax=Romanomermis culicivorax TaxID=13658 RepID=A0A915IGJ2_ROMCU